MAQEFIPVRFYDIKVCGFSFYGTIGAGMYKVFSDGQLLEITFFPALEPKFYESFRIHMTGFIAFNFVAKLICCKQNERKNH
jgi:hypothetical protein